MFDAIKIPDLGPLQQPAECKCPVIVISRWLVNICDRNRTLGEIG